MTMTSPTLNARVDAAMAAAAAASRTITGGHGRDYAAYEPYWVRGVRTCKCGRRFSTPQGLGLHLKALQVKADKAWCAAYDEAMGVDR